ncbi:vesicle-associated protein 2-2-like [Pyrus ussuriensis x Pyrus communis]|uniref:Vesicle-associated protein 2-2-like n=1 Tax=Pyrus ussuriensis x Pyrus communis TaxID=2448454 RepID=A0A5N5HQE1_9ROSA|nr:vesicle-associated protein 2-2-like [Pyrus ussuriensis x Pyrus communis]
MSTQLLEIQPKELKFLFELKKQSSCSIRLTNLTDNYVAFKVKTTSPKKYCVRPNVGVVLPNSTSEFSVMMQAPRTSMTDMDCKDKFLIQSTIVSSATTDEDITSSMFSKDGGKYVEEKKLRVTLVSPPNSPMLSPMKVDLKQGLGHEHSFLKDQFGGVEIPPPLNKVTNDVKFTATSEKPNPSTKTELKPSKDVELKPEKDVELKPEKDFELKSTKDVELKPAKYEALEPEKDMEVKPEKEAELKPKKEAELKQVIDVELISAKDVELKPPKAMEFKLAKDVELNATKIVEDLELVKDIQEMKSKLNALELKLSQAEVTILKLTEERSSSIQETRIMQEQLARLSRRGVDVKTVHVGFPLLFVCMVAIISVAFGYCLRP